jgi:hypothetical protein
LDDLVPLPKVIMMEADVYAEPLERQFQLAAEILPSRFPGAVHPEQQPLMGR